MASLSAGRLTILLLLVLAPGPDMVVEDVEDAAGADFATLAADLPSQPSIPVLALIG